MAREEDDVTPEFWFFTILLALYWASDLIHAFLWRKRIRKIEADIASMTLTQNAIASVSGQYAVHAGNALCKLSGEIDEVRAMVDVLACRAGVQFVRESERRH